MTENNNLEKRDINGIMLGNIRRSSDEDKNKDY